MENWQSLEFHPFACEYPLMTEEQTRDLAADMAKNGQRVPIILLAGKPGEQPFILDGRNRFLAAKIAGIKPFFDEVPADYMPEEALREYVVSLNEHRRHLTPEDLAARRAKRLGIVAQLHEEGLSANVIAEQTGVSRTQARSDIATVTNPGWQGCRPVQESPGSSADESTPAPMVAPERVKGKDGKSYPAKAKPKASPALTDTAPQSQGGNEPMETEPTEPVILRDPLGMPYEAGSDVATAFEFAKECKALANDMQACYERYNALLLQPGGEYLRDKADVKSRDKEGNPVERHSRNLQAVIEELDQLAPYTQICPGCFSKGHTPNREMCSYCHGRKFFTKTLFDSPQSVHKQWCAKVRAHIAKKYQPIAA